MKKQLFMLIYLLNLGFSKSLDAVNIYIFNSRVNAALNSYVFNTLNPNDKKEVFCLGLVNAVSESLDDDDKAEIKKLSNRVNEEFSQADIDLCLGSNLVCCVKADNANAEALKGLLRMFLFEGGKKIQGEQLSKRIKAEKTILRRDACESVLSLIEKTICFDKLWQFIVSGVLDLIERHFRPSGFEDMFEPKEECDPLVKRVLKIREKTGLNMDFGFSDSSQHTEQVRMDE